MTPYIGEGAEECKLTAHMLKTDCGVLWKVSGFFLFVCKNLNALCLEIYF